METTAAPAHLDHYSSHQTEPIEMLPNGAVHNDNTMGMMMGDDEHPRSHQMNHHGGHHQMEHGMDGGMSMMKMYFHYGLGDLVLFKGVVMDSNAKLLLTCFILFVCGILVEFIDYSRGYLSCRCRASSLGQYKSSSESRLVANDNHQQQQQRTATTRNQNWSCCAGSEGCDTSRQAVGQEREHAELVHESKYQEHKPSFFPVRSSDPHIYRILQAFLQFIRTGISLGLMLVAMTYNVCLIFPILLGKYEQACLVGGQSSLVKRLPAFARIKHRCQTRLKILISGCLLTVFCTTGSAVGFYIFYRPALDSKSVVCH
jgi:hypothetical protein